MHNRKTKTQKTQIILGANLKINVGFTNYDDHLIYYTTFAFYFQSATFSTYSRVLYPHRIQTRMLSYTVLLSFVGSLLFFFCRLHHTYERRANFYIFFWLFSILLFILIKLFVVFVFCIAKLGYQYTFHFNEFFHFIFFFIFFFVVLLIILLILLFFPLLFFSFSLVCFCLGFSSYCSVGSMHSSKRPNPLNGEVNCYWHIFFIFILSSDK